MSYEDRLQLAIARCGHKEVLRKKESQEILNNSCPYCIHFMECDRIIDESSPGHTRQICKVLSSELKTVWLEIGDNRPTVEPGNRYGKLVVVIPQKPDEFGHKRWLCKCDCGNPKIVRGDNLISEKTISCGCHNGKTFSRASTGKFERKEREYHRGSSRNPDGGRHRDISSFTSKVNQHISILADVSINDYDYYFYVLGVCPECKKPASFEDHGFKWCPECGLMGGDVPFEDAFSILPSEAILKSIDSKYAKIKPLFSFCRPLYDENADDVIVKRFCILPNEVKRPRMDYIDQWQEIEARMLYGTYNGPTEPDKPFAFSDDLRASIVDTKRQLFPNNPEKWYVNYPGELDLNGNVIA